jgi:hypothetical protein
MLRRAEEGALACVDLRPLWLLVGPAAELVAGARPGAFEVEDSLLFPVPSRSLCPANPASPRRAWGTSGSEGGKVPNSLPISLFAASRVRQTSR